MKVITRFAPSPTGFLHAGNYRTALFSYIYARQNGGTFLLRIEDTDLARSKKEYEDNIVDSLKWLGLEYDGFHRQSEKTSTYKECLEKLIASGHAYVSKETPKEPGDRTEVIRFKNPNKKVAFDDMIRGRIEFDTTELGDFVIARSMTEPVFHLVVVVDDAESNITHIVRAEDHISNTPRHILIYEALGLTVPKYAHIPLVLSPDRSKLSKRKGALPITEYRARGYVPEALVNYLALLGWHPADEREVLSKEEILKEFSLERVQKSGAIFDEEKLKWLNRQYLLKLSDADFVSSAGAFIPEWLTSDSKVSARVLPLIREKISTFAEIKPLFEQGGELSFVKELSNYTKEQLLWKKNPDPAASKKHLDEARKVITGLDQNSFTAESIKIALWPYAEANGKGDVLWPLRMSLTGQDKSPDPFISAAILGKEEVLRRIDIASGKLNA